MRININDRWVEATEGSTILEAAKQNDILIPSLCHLEGIHQQGSCRICVVEVEGVKNLQPSCMVEARDGMIVHTNTARVNRVRRNLYELMLSDHPKDCLTCARNQSCELQELGHLLGVETARFEGAQSLPVMDFSSPSILRDTSKCILCRRCITVCREVQGVGILDVQNRGFGSMVAPAGDLPLNEVNCTYCGQCVLACPVGALQEVSSIDRVLRALFDKNKRVVVQTAPAIRAALGEEFGYEPGTLVTGKMASALRRLGFDDVFDTNFTADLTIIEEGNEFLERVKAALVGEGAVLPMITSCSPGWIKFVEHTFPDKLEHLSSCKSPHTMLGALAKSYYADKIGVAPEDVFVVSIMPCTAKKYEISRPEMMNNGVPNVDAVLTTRELARMIKGAGIDFNHLPDGEFDSPLGLSSGAADIFGTTGGVMEAALRTVYELVTGRELPFEDLHVTPIVGLEEIKEAALTIENPLPEYAFLDGVVVRVAVTSGLKGARKLMEEVESGQSPYHFIEVMGCPGGCINGGGQPRPKTGDTREKRMEAIYKEDESKDLRKSHENISIATLYKEFLGAPLGDLSHELLHTTYTKRSVY